MYPRELVPEPLLALNAFYVETFNDALILTRPAWFRFFSEVELWYQLPMAVLAVCVGVDRIVGHMLLWAFVCAFTTITCLVEIAAAETMAVREKAVLGALYGVYALICGYLCSGTCVGGADAV